MEARRSITCKLDFTAYVSTLHPINLSKECHTMEFITYATQDLVGNSIGWLVECDAFALFIAGFPFKLLLDSGVVTHFIE